MLEQDLMKAAVTKAIFDTLTPEKREELVAKAIANLLATPEANSANYFGDKKKSELQSIFEQTARVVANEVVREKMTTDPAFRASVGEVFYKAVTIAFEGENANQLAARIASQLVEGLKLDRY